MDTGILEGLTKEKFDSIPIEQIVSSTRYLSADNCSSDNQSVELYDVELLRKSQASEDIAKQLITTLGTLIVAVAGFYFGTRAISTANETQNQNQKGNGNGTGNGEPETGEGKKLPK